MANPFHELATAAKKLEADAIVLFHKDVTEVAAGIHTALAQAEADARQAVANASPDVKQVADQTLKMVEQAILTALAAHGL